MEYVLTFALVMAVLVVYGIRKMCVKKHPDPNDKVVDPHIAPDHEAHTDKTKSKQ